MDYDKQAAAEALRKLGYPVDQNMFSNPEVAEAPLGSVTSTQSAAPVPTPSPARQPNQSVESKAPAVTVTVQPPTSSAPMSENVPGPAPRSGWSPTKLSPEEENQFQHDMRNSAGYKDWREAWQKDYGEEPNYDDPQGDYDYRGAWKNGVVPEPYKHDGKYHWGSSTPDGTMLKAPDHPTAWMEYFMRQTGKDPNDVGVKNEEEGRAWAAANGYEPAQAMHAPSGREPGPEATRPPAPPAGPPAPPAPSAEATPPPAPKPEGRPAQRPATVQQPAPSPAPSAPAVSPEDQRLLDAAKPAPGPARDGVEDRGFNPSDSTKTLQGVVGATKNRSLDLTEEKGQVLDSFSNAVSENGKARANLAMDNYLGQRDRADKAQGRAEVSREDMHAQLADLKQQMGKPPTDTVGIVMGLVSAFAASKGKMGLAQAFQMLGGKMNDRMKRYQGGLEAGEKNLEGLGKIANYDRLISADENEREALIAKGLDAEIDASLDEARTQAKTAEERNAVDAFKNQLMQKMAGDEVVRRQKAAAAAREAEAYRRIQNARSEEEADIIRRQYGKVGEKVARDVQNTNQEVAGTTGKLLQNELTGAKARVEAAKAEDGGAEGGGVVQGWTSTKALPNQVQAKVADRQMALSTVQSRLERLADIAQGVKSGKISRFDTDSIKEVGDIRNELVSLRTQLAGAGAPTGKEYDTTIDTISDPQEFFKLGDAKTLLTRTMTNARQGHERALRSVGYVPDAEFQAMKKAGGRAAPVTAGDVEMRGPDGEIQKVSPAVASALRKNGWSAADEADDE